MKPSNLKSGKPWKLGRSQKVFIFRGKITLLRSGQKKIIFKGGRGGGEGGGSCPIIGGVYLLGGGQYPSEHHATGRGISVMESSLR